MRKETVTIRRRKKTVEEDDSISFVIEKDFTQVYDCFSKMSAKIRSITSYKLLFWLLANKAADDGTIHVDAIIYEEFNEFLSKECGPECKVIRATFDNCIAELKKVGALLMKGRGHYKANSFGFWRGPLKDRKELLLKEYKSDTIMFNPDHDTKLLGQ